MVSTTQNVSDITSYGYPSQSTLRINTSRKDGGFYGVQTKAMERIMW
jgi:hypothetical protein